MEILIKKLGTKIDVFTEDFPEVSQKHIYEYGLRQLLNDCHSDIVRKTWTESTEAFSVAILAEVEKKVEALRKGEIKTRREGKSERDKLIQFYAETAIEKKLAESKKTLAMIGKDKAKEIVEGYIALAHAKLAKMADKEIARREAEREKARSLINDEDIDLSALLAD